MTPTAAATADDVLVSCNPATGVTVGQVPVTPVDRIAAIVARARAAQPEWQARGIDERARLLATAAPLLMERVDKMGTLLTQEMGKPLKEGIEEVRHCAESMGKTIAQIAEALQPQQLTDDSTESTLYRDPFGVCLVITPWNFPVAMPHWTVLPALIAGNTVVLKPSEETPLVAQAYADVLNEVLPDDVLLVVHGADDQGKALVASDIDLIAFTGSREAGKHILGAASGGLKRVILELGGKDPMIVLDDADIEEAAQFAVTNSFRNAGQVCVSTERIYVDESIAETFERRVVDLTAEQKVGPGDEDGVTIGPMVSGRQKSHVLDQIESAKRDGATVVYGDEGHHDNFVMPTVLTHVNHNMQIMRDETFGPVACIMRFNDIDEAVRLANDTPYGLGATVFGDPGGSAKDVARRLSAGMVGLNKGCAGADGAPWVGAQQSGYGFHSGPEGHRQFTQARILSTPKA
jgi:succinate-semialdehyde dehydrogenase/glutarate-semialdehyde dehydrogenase